MAKIKIGGYESFTTLVFKEGIELEIPNNMSVEQYLTDLEKNYPNTYEQITEDIEDQNILKEEGKNIEFAYWYKIEGDDKIRLIPLTLD